MRIVKITTLILILAQLSACAVISKKECMVANWQGIGFEVGYQGDLNPNEAFNKRSQICNKHGYEADYSAYSEGYQQGVEAYCEVPNAVKLGAKGVPEFNVSQLCPEFDNPGFSSAYRAGLKLNELQRRANVVRQDLDRLQSNQSYNSQRISNLYQTLRKLESSDQSRARQIRRQIQSLRYDNDRLQRDIEYARRAYRQRQSAVRNYVEILKREYGEESL